MNGGIREVTGQVENAVETARAVKNPKENFSNVTRRGHASRRDETKAFRSHAL